MSASKAARGESIRAEGGRKRILLATPEFVGPVRNGGIGTAFTAMAHQFRDAGYEVTVLFTVGQNAGDDTDLKRWQRHYAHQGIELIPLAADSDEPVLEAPWYCWRAYRLYLWMRRNAHRFDMAWFPEWRGEAYFVLSAKAVGTDFTDLPIGVVTHGPTAWAEGGNYALPFSIDTLYLEHMERHSAEMADIVVSPSQYLLDWEREQGWTLPQDTRVMQNMMMPGEVVEAGTPRQLDDVDEWVFFGRLEVRKGLKIFIKALQRLPREALKARQVTFMGKAISDEGFNLVNYVEEALSGLPCKLEIITTYARNEALEYLSAGNRVAVIPSLIENSPYTVLECLTRGIAFIASDVGGIGELIHPEDRARALFSPTPSDIARAMQRIQENGYSLCRTSVAPRQTDKAWLELQGELLTRETRAKDARKAPHITVCLTHHERPELLETALQSLRDQTYDDFDVVLVDDGSQSQAALDYLDTLESEFQRRGWTIVRQDNAYLGAARNHAASRANGEYILFMDDDNLAKPWELSTFAQAAAHSGADILTTVSDLFTDDGPNGAPEASNRLWLPLGPAVGLGALRNVFGDANSLIRRTLFQSLGGFTTDYGVGHEDWEFFSRACLSGADLRVIPEPLFWYRVTPDSMIRTGEPAVDLSRNIRPYQAMLPDGLGHALALGLRLQMGQELTGQGSWTELKPGIGQRMRLTGLACLHAASPRLVSKFLACVRRDGLRFALRRALEYAALRQQA